VADGNYCRVLKLHSVEPKVVTDDIRLYVQASFDASLVRRSKPDIPPWYTREDVDNLAKQANGLFIFAATAVRSILVPPAATSRKARLATLSTRSYTHSASHTKHLDDIYSFVINEARIGLDSDEQGSLQCILASILAARMPLSVSILAELLGVDVQDLRDTLSKVHSVLQVPDDNAARDLRPFHASFGDFLHERAADDIRAAAALGHSRLAVGCLRRMKQDDLCFNVSHSQTSYEPNPPPTADLIPVSLEYACLQWAHHIVASEDTLPFTSDVETVFWPKFLFWLEVLSVLCRLGDARALLLAAKSCKVSGRLQ
jgi:hypothetical protein